MINNIIHLKNSPKRFEIFKEHYLEIHSFTNDGSSGHKKGITKFCDLSKKEFSEQYLTLKYEPGMCEKAKLTFLTEDPKISESLDWRTKGKVSEVKDQGQCGSCWAFSTIGFLESQSLIKNNKNQTFSEQQLVDCDKKTDAGCNGGLMQSALNYIADQGIEGEKSYPYKGRDETCAYKKDSVIAKASNVQCYEDLNDISIKKYLTTVGPLAIAVDANEFQTYDSGILACSGSELDHGVLLVGYGSDKGKDYWIVKNSWGKNWGEKGFIRISAKKEENCAIGKYVAIAELK